MAAFVTSFNASDVASYRIVGTKGQLHVDPAYEYAEGLAYEMTVNVKVTRKRLGRRDQFAPEGRQRITKPGVQKPALVKVQSASEN